MTIAPSDKRFAVIKLLLAYTPEDATDDEQRRRILSFIEETPACFERTHLAGHITGSAWVVDKTGTKVLLTHHKKLTKWLQLGGHADGSSDPLATAQREAMEESSLKNIRSLASSIFDVDVHPIPAQKEEPAHFHYDIRFVFEVVGDETIVANEESNQVAWVPMDQLSSFSDEESLLRMARKWKKFRHTVNPRPVV